MYDQLTAILLKASLELVTTSIIKSDSVPAFQAGRRRFSVVGPVVVSEVVSFGARRCATGVISALF